VLQALAGEHGAIETELAGALFADAHVALGVVLGLSCSKSRQPRQGLCSRRKALQAPQFIPHGGNQVPADSLQHAQSPSLIHGLVVLRMQDHVPQDGCSIAVSIEIGDRNR